MADLGSFHQSAEATKNKTIATYMECIGDNSYYMDVLSDTGDPYLMSEDDVRQADVEVKTRVCEREPAAGVPTSTSVAAYDDRATSSLQCVCIKRNN